MSLTQVNVMSGSLRRALGPWAVVGHFVGHFCGSHAVLAWVTWRGGEERRGGEAGRRGRSFKLERSARCQETNAQVVATRTRRTKSADCHWCPSVGAPAAGLPPLQERCMLTGALPPCGMPRVGLGGRPMGRPRGRLMGECLGVGLGGRLRGRHRVCLGLA